MMVTKLKQEQLTWRSRKMRIAGSIANLRSVCEELKVWKEDKLLHELSKTERFLNKLNDDKFVKAGGTLNRKGGE